MSSSPYLTLGVISGLISSIIFLLYHAIDIVPIWFVLPFAIIFGMATGLGLSYSQRVFFGDDSVTSTVKMLLIYLLPILIMDIFVISFVDPIFTIEEATAPGGTSRLLGFAYSVVVPYSVIYGLVQGGVLGKIVDNTAATTKASVFTNFIIFAGIAHNFILFNLVNGGERADEVRLAHIKALAVILGLMLIYTIIFQLSLRLVKQRNISTTIST